MFPIRKFQSRSYLMMRLKKFWKQTGSLPMRDMMQSMSTSLA